MDFRKLPLGNFTLTNVTVPACLLGREGDLVTTEISIEGGRIGAPQPVAVDMGGAMVFPAFVDMHTHLDKGHIWPRSPNPDGTFMGALNTVRADSAARWSAEDLRPRIEFSLRSALAHGTRAIRTHLDSIAPQDAITWPVFREIQAEWAGRIDLQGVCLIGCDKWTDDSGAFGRTADLVAGTRGGVLGMVTYPVPDLRDRIRGFFAQAEARGLDADFHVDETMDPGVETLRDIAELKMETGFPGRVVVWPNIFYAGQQPFLRYFTRPGAGRMLGPFEAMHDLRLYRSWLRTGRVDPGAVLQADADLVTRTAAGSRSALTERDALADVAVADLIADDPRAEPQFFTFNHPRRALMADVARRLLRKAGLDAARPPPARPEPLGRYRVPGIDTAEGMQGDPVPAQGTRQPRPYGLADLAAAFQAVYDADPVYREPGAIRLTPAIGWEQEFLART